jgi:hypothetical protein
MQKVVIVLSILVVFFLGYYYASSKKENDISKKDNGDSDIVIIVEKVKDFKPVSDACRDFTIDPNKDCYKQLYPLTLPYVNYTKSFVPTFAPQPCV